VDKSGSDEIRTYDTGFVGVDLPVLTSLPRMLEAEKEQILGKNNSGTPKITELGRPQNHRAG
jgi:hypothetical protein